MRLKLPPILAQLVYSVGGYISRRSNLPAEECPRGAPAKLASGWEIRLAGNTGRDENCLEQPSGPCFDRSLPVSGCPHVWSDCFRVSETSRLAVLAEASTVILLEYSQYCSETVSHGPPIRNGRLSREPR